MRLFRPSERLRLAALTAAAIVAASAAHAQDAGGGGRGGFFSRGLGVGGGQHQEPGAYASPSAIPDAPSADLGVNLPKPLQTFEPIALPDTGRPAAPSELSLPALPAYAPQNSASLNPAVRTRRLHIDGHLVKGGPKIPSGLVWRLFSPVPGADNKLPVVASFSGGSADFDVPTGSYLLHVGFGQAGVTRKIDLSGNVTNEEVVLDAGGLKLNARVAEKAIPPGKVSFSVYAGDADAGESSLIVNDVPGDAMLVLNAGNYHVVSRYGSENAEVTGEVKVEAGKLTDITLQHRAAALTMKLVREKGGEAIADTAWQVLDADGGVVRQSVGAFPSMVLAEGDYVVIAKNREKSYQRDFRVEAGHDADVELLTADVAPLPGADQGSGD